MVFDLTPALPELFLLISGLGLLVVGALMREPEATRIVSGLSALSLMVAIIIVLASNKDVHLTFGGHFVADAFSAFLKVLIFVGTALAILLAQGYLADLRLQRFDLL